VPGVRVRARIPLSFESLAAVIARDLAEIVRRGGARRSSEETAELLTGLYETAQKALALAVRAVREADAEAAGQVLAMRQTVAFQEESPLERQAGRLRPDDPDHLVLARLQMSIIDKLTRIFDLTARVARGVLPPAPQPTG